MEKMFAKVQPILELLKRYIVIVVIVLVGAVYGYIIYTSGQLAKSQPSEEEVNSGYTRANHPKMDESVRAKITELQETNVKFNSLVDSNRTNPFEE